MTVFENVIKTLAGQLEIDPNIINENTSIVEDLGADSLDLVELIMSLEEEYNIIIANEGAVVLKTVGEIVAFIERQIHKSV